jgi:hypothetical protein
MVSRVGEHIVQAKERKPHPRSREKVASIGQAGSVGVRQIHLINP